MLENTYTVYRINNLNKIRSRTVPNIILTDVIVCVVNVLVDFVALIIELRSYLKHKTTDTYTAVFIELLRN